MGGAGRVVLFVVGRVLVGRVEVGGVGRVLGRRVDVGGAGRAVVGLVDVGGVGHVGGEVAVESSCVVLEGDERRVLYLLKYSWSNFLLVTCTLLSISLFVLLMVACKILEWWFSSDGVAVALRVFMEVMHRLVVSLCFSSTCW